MKKVSALSLCFLIIAGLTACGSGRSDTEHVSYNADERSAAFDSSVETAAESGAVNNNSDSGAENSDIADSGSGNPNPQLIIYSTTLGVSALTVRIMSCFICGCAAGLLIRLCYKDKGYFNLTVLTNRITMTRTRICFSA